MKKTILSCLVIFFVTYAQAQVPGLVNYQGRVSVGTTNFNSPPNGLFKFALTNSTGSTYYWTNDGTGSAGGQPTNAVSLTVSKGLYSVLLGDTSIANMTAIPASVWANPDVRLRVWFDDGVPAHGSQQLSPDQRLAPTAYLGDGVVSSAKIATGAVTAANIASGAVGSAALAPGAVAAPVSVAGTTQTAVANTAYVATNSSPTVFTLPASANVGDVVQISGAGPGGWSVNPFWNLQVNTAGLNWASVASSADGTHLAAVIANGGIYTSTNYGPWTLQTAGLASSALWQSIASSADGTHLIAAVLAGGLYTSTNSGVSWTQSTVGLPGSAAWTAVASSADGTHLVAVVSPGGIYTSTNSGASWTLQAGASTSAAWQAVASSADGSDLVAAISGSGSGIYTSTNFGVSWTLQATGLPANQNWGALASSTDGHSSDCGLEF